MTKSQRKMKLSWPVKGAALLFALVVALVCIVSYPGNTDPGFQEYGPTGLPPGLEVKSADLFVQRYPKLLPSFSKHLNLNLNVANSWITESKSDGQAFYDGWCISYQRIASCRQYRTPDGQAYQLAIYDKAYTGESVQEAYFIKGGTSIDFTLRDYKEISPDGWGAIIDSFQPARYDHPQIIRGSTRGP